MVTVRFVAAALVGIMLVACTNQGPAAPPDLETESEESRSATGTKGDVELAPEEPAAEDSEEALGGLPRPEEVPAQSPAPAPSTSTSPLCLKSMTCSATNVTGSKACRQQESSTGDIFCCPRFGDRIVNGACVPKVCAPGLACGATSAIGTSVCRETATSTTDLHCCPIATWDLQGGRCVAPICGTGLTCSGSPTVGAPACRQSTTSTTNVYCCTTPGAKIVNGKCQ